jgi:ABC-type Fe3+ transport system permease subunit
MRSRMTISRIDPGSVAKVFGLLYFVIGLIPGVVFAVAAVADTRKPFGLVFAILLPVLYALGGVIGGLILGFVYNLVAGAIGGIVIDLDQHPFEYQGDAE